MNMIIIRKIAQLGGKEPKAEKSGPNNENPKPVVKISEEQQT